MTIIKAVNEAIVRAVKLAEEYSHEDAKGGRPSEEADTLFYAIKEIAIAAGVPINPHKWYE